MATLTSLLVFLVALRARASAPGGLDLNGTPTESLTLSDSLTLSESLTLTMSQELTISVESRILRDAQLGPGSRAALYLPPPVVRMSLRASLDSACPGLLIDATDSYVSSQYGTPRFDWIIEATPGMFTSTSRASLFRVYMAQIRSSRSVIPTLFIPLNVIPDRYPFLVRLNVFDVLGNRGEKTLTAQMARTLSTNRTQFIWTLSDSQVYVSDFATADRAGTVVSCSTVSFITSHNSTLGYAALLMALRESFSADRTGLTVGTGWTLYLSEPKGRVVEVDTGLQPALRLPPYSFAGQSSNIVQSRTSLSNTSFDLVITQRYIAVPSPLVLVIRGAPTIRNGKPVVWQRGVFDTLTIDASQSYDPDSPTGNNGECKFRWTVCFVSPTQVGNTTCDPSPAAPLPVFLLTKTDLPIYTAQGTAVLPLPAAVYLFQVSFTCTGRVVTGSVIIEFVPGRRLFPFIEVLNSLYPYTSLPTPPGWHDVSAPFLILRAVTQDNTTAYSWRITSISNYSNKAAFPLGNTGLVFVASRTVLPGAGFTVSVTSSAIPQPNTTSSFFSATCTFAFLPSGAVGGVRLTAPAHSVVGGQSFALRATGVSIPRGLLFSYVDPTLNVNVPVGVADGGEAVECTAPVFAAPGEFAVVMQVPGLVGTAEFRQSVALLPPSPLPNFAAALASFEVLLRDGGMGATLVLLRAAVRLVAVAATVPRPAAAKMETQALTSPLFDVVLRALEVIIGKTVPAFESDGAINRNATLSGSELDMFLHLLAVAAMATGKEVQASRVLDALESVLVRRETASVPRGLDMALQVIDTVALAVLKKYTNVTMLNGTTSVDIQYNTGQAVPPPSVDLADRTALLRCAALLKLVGRILKITLNVGESKCIASPSKKFPDMLGGEASVVARSILPTVLCAINLTDWNRKITTPSFTAELSLITGSATVGFSVIPLFFFVKNTLSPLTIIDSDDTVTAVVYPKYTPPTVKLPDGLARIVCRLSNGTVETTIPVLTLPGQVYGCSVSNGFVASLVWEVSVTLLYREWSKEDKVLQPWQFLIIAWGCFLLYIAVSAIVRFIRRIGSRPRDFDELRWYRVGAFRSRLWALPRGAPWYDIITAAALDEHDFAFFFAEHHSLSTSQRAAVAFSTLLGLFALNSVWRDKLHYAAAGVVTPFILFPIVEFVVFLMRRTPRWSWESRVWTVPEEHDMDLRLDAPHADFATDNNASTLLCIDDNKEMYFAPETVDWLIGCAAGELAIDRCLSGVFLLAVAGRVRQPNLHPPFCIGDAIHQAIAISGTSLQTVQDCIRQNENQCQPLFGEFIMMLSSSPAIVDTAERDAAKEMAYIMLSKFSQSIPLVFPTFGSSSRFIEILIEYYEADVRVMTHWLGQQKGGVSLALAAPSLGQMLPNVHDVQSPPKHTYTAKTFPPDIATASQGMMEMWQLGISEVQRGRVFAAATVFAKVKQYVQRSMNVNPAFGDASVHSFGKHWSRYYCMQLFPFTPDSHAQFDTLYSAQERAAIGSSTSMTVSQQTINEVLDSNHMQLSPHVREAFDSLGLERPRAPPQDIVPIEGALARIPPPPGPLALELRHSTGGRAASSPFPLELEPLTYPGGSPLYRSDFAEVAPTAPPPVLDEKPVLPPLTKDYTTMPGRSVYLRLRGSQSYSGPSKYAPEPDGTPARPCATWEQALRLLEYNSELILAPGVYPPLTFCALPRGVAVRALPGDEVTVRARGSQTVAVLLLYARDVVLQNLVLDCQLGPAVRCVDCADVRLDGCVVWTRRPGVCAGSQLAQSAAEASSLLHVQTTDFRTSQSIETAPLNESQLEKPVIGLNTVTSDVSQSAVALRSNMYTRWRFLTITHREWTGYAAQLIVLCWLLYCTIHILLLPYDISHTPADFFSNVDERQRWYMSCGISVAVELFALGPIQCMAAILFGRRGKSGGWEKMIATQRPTK